MISIDRVLVPIDFSEPSRIALAFAARLATWYDARVTVLHAINPALVAANVAASADLMRLVPPDGGRRELEREAAAAVHVAGIDPHIVEIAVVEGDAVDSIVRTADAAKNTIVVLGTHGYGGFDRFILGSVTEKVLRKTACPVVTVPPASHTRPSLPFKRLLCALDFSPSSLAALNYALSVAKEADAHLTLVHVLNLPHADADGLVEVAPGAFNFRSSVGERALTRLETLRTDAGMDYCEITCTLAYGRPHERIIELASSARADLIVMGVHGRNRLDLALFGSTTNQVVRHATCPVLTLRH